MLCRRQDPVADRGANLLEYVGIRCPARQVDPRQKPRLIEITGNLRERITEARAHGWRGEIDGLQTGRNAAKAKLANLNRAPADGRPQLVALGIPTFTANQPDGEPVKRTHDFLRQCSSWVERIFTRCVGPRRVGAG